MPENLVNLGSDFHERPLKILFIENWLASFPKEKSQRQIYDIID